MATFEKLAVSLAVVAVGCAGTAPRQESDAREGSRARLSASAAGDTATATDEGEKDEELEGVELRASGWLELPRSLIHPWCSAVLIAEDVVLTSEACARGVARELRFWTGDGQEVVNVTHAEPLASAPDLAALVLETPVVHTEPTSSVRVEEVATGADVQGTSLVYGTDDGSTERWVWEGTFQNDDVGPLVSVTPLDPSGTDEGAGHLNAPSCHGDNGGGVFTSDGSLLGIVVAAQASSLCVDTLRLVAVREAMDEARTLSRILST